jgi:lipopolysaccharide biosynthesis regulator YciM
MEFEYWWVIGFPVFFGLGWLAARIDIKHLLSESRQLPESYFKGLNFLLNEQPDRAIEAFIEVVKGDRESIELHFTLGSLFRRRGETERAIRIHRSLLDRGDITESQRLQALFELGQDYLKAGLLDRAEAAFEKLRGTAFERDAMSFLVEIYQQEREWEKAIAVTRALEGKDSFQQKAIANFYCEWANSLLNQSRNDEAREKLHMALEFNRRCVRASLILGDLHAAEGRHADAIACWKRIEQQDPPYLALCAARLLSSYRATGAADEGLVLVKGFLSSFPSLDLLDVVFQSVLELEGAQSAYELVKEELRRNPTLLGLDRLLEAQLVNAPSERRADLELIRKLIHNHTLRLSRFQCSNCGFKARQFHWKCPGCGGWETYPPRRTEEFDLAA